MAPQLDLLATSVSKDEPCWWLVEVVSTPLAIQKRFKGFRPSNMRGRHRFQIVTVNRNDRLARHITDMGDVSLYGDCGGLNVPGLWENTVAELRDIAERWRGDQQWERDIIANKQGESKLIETWLKQMENRRRAGQSVFGPGVSIQR